MPKTARARTIFLCYRREDTITEAGRLYDLLAMHFGDTHVFRDFDSIGLGSDFSQRITAFISSCDVVVVLIGSKWLTVVDANGGRKLDNQQDFVRMEIETALHKQIPVVPILVGAAKVPMTDDLPRSLAQLHFHQGLTLTQDDFRAQVTRLIKSIELLPSRKRATVEATSIGFRWMCIRFCLNEVHWIHIDKSRSLSHKIKLDGQNVSTSRLSFDGLHHFSINDGGRQVNVSIAIESGITGLTSVMLAVDGSQIYSSSSVTESMQMWQERAVVTRASPIGIKVMYLVVQLEKEHTITIDLLYGRFWERIDIDGQPKVRKLDLIGEYDLVIEDGGRHVPACIAIDKSVHSNIIKVVLIVDGDIVFES